MAMDNGTDVKDREESFGEPIPDMKVGRGEMHLFGHKIRDGVWPGKATSVDSKTGFPEGYDKGSKKSE